MVEAERQIGETISVERRYYLSSLRGNVQQFAEAVRGHWSIENTVHWSSDIIDFIIIKFLAEDTSTDESEAESYGAHSRFP